MQSRLYFRLLAIVVAVIVCLALVQAWRADHRDRAQFVAELAATKQLLTAADARQRNRDAQLVQTLSALAAEKRAIVTPAQIVRELSNVIPLPAPLTLPGNHKGAVGARFSASLPTSPPQVVGSETPGTPAANSADTRTALANSLPTAPSAAVIPGADLKPLYDFAIDCKSCQARLAVAQNDLADERQKTVALTKERDDALRISKGGTVWRRVARGAKFFIIGAAAGALAAKSAH